MKKIISLTLIGGALMLGQQFICAADTATDAKPAAKPAADSNTIAKPAAAAPSAAQKELNALVAKVRALLKDGKNTEKDMEPVLKEFDDLLASHKNEKTDDVAQILQMKALLYLQVLEDDKKGTDAILQLKKDFPDTRQGKGAYAMLENIKKQEDARKLQAALKPGTVFPDFEEVDLDGKPLSISNYKGKVVLVDFWATWCGPCVSELPNVVAAYKKYHGKGFEIIGISLDRQQDKEKLTNFIKEKEMPWVQFFDGGGWTNKLAKKYGINSIPATYLLDKEGKIIAKGLRGEALDKELEKQLK